MKLFIVLVTSALAAVASAGHLYASGAPSLAGPIESGSSSQFRSEDNYGNYAFGYDEVHSSGGSSRREEETNGVRRGSYALSDADGRRRIVNYVADASGFHADIQTNEPGVEAKDPANVSINKAVLAAPAPVLAAPAPIAAAAAAPVPFFAAAAVKGYTAAAAPAPLVPAPLPVAPVKGYAAAPAPLVPAPLPVAPVKGYAAAPAPLVPAPLPVAPVKGYADAPIYEAAVPIEDPTPRAFSYSFGATHVAPIAPQPYPAPARIYSGAPLGAPLPAAPIFQQRLAY